MLNVLTTLIIVLALWCKFGASNDTQQQAVCAGFSNLCPGGETDALVLMSAQCNTNEITIEIRRADSNFISDGYALYYNCSSQFDEVAASNGVDIFFNTFDDSDVAKVSIATTTEPYSCVITGCARSITSCWASLKQTVAQCEFKGINGVSSSIQTTSVSIDQHPSTTASTSTGIISASSSSNNDQLSTLPTQPTSASTDKHSSITESTTTILVHSSSSKSTPQGSTTTASQESAKTTTVISMTTSSGLSVTSRTPLQSDKPTIADRVIENNSTTLVVTLVAIFTVTVIVILLLLFVGVCLLIRNFKPTRISSKIGSVDLTEMNKTESSKDGEIISSAAVIQTLDLRGSMITVYNSLNDLSMFENTVQDVFRPPQHDTVISVHCIQHGVTQTSTTSADSTEADCISTVRNQADISSNRFETVIQDSLEDEHGYMRADDYDKDESISSYCMTSSVGSTTSNGYITTATLNREDQPNDTPLQEKTAEYKWQEHEEHSEDSNKRLTDEESSKYLYHDNNGPFSYEDLNNDDDYVVMEKINDDDYVVMEKINDDSMYIDASNGYHYINDHYCNSI